MPNPINEIKNRVFNKQKEADLVDTWHYLMINYGWIPFDEFLSLDASLLNKLVQKLNEMNEKQNKSMPKRRR